MQSTIANTVHFSGAGLHTGRLVRLAVHPADVDHGIVFHRTDLDGAARVLPARWDMVEQTQLCTRLINDDGGSVSTIEHLMAALAGLGVSNALITLDGPEVPILDGSAAPFVRKLVMAGVVSQGRESRILKILKPVEVRSGDGIARLEPSSGYHIDFDIDFTEAAIGHQTRSLNMRNGAFVRTLCDSRTFCRQSDVDAMRANGLALGGTHYNAVVFDGEKVLSPGGLRHEDEPVRHKMLDALGDLSLAGGPILGRYTGIRAGHALTNKLLRAVLSDPECHEWVSCDPLTALSLPGVGVRPADLALCA
ncbi:UDP-3-O-[3-hydroxymyristoyl] N-acetylglucosamine deacetylase [Meridianimarinicoccus roseus]|jgi:UDP-3-O-[3-hydroxymyristoyl] N-acetylglucosamine deacetylase|uniref:UDP-3-O-acyl-N-acetylglucosamine deacetylase n=1 Tax=Meridianimarinicoccus roseus TaxID=2072018 RepID=A0A2V2LEP6_9RHOB|nr:UDP-3-O-acyl-N-acetylglucosamine deacetylase [Meridianimarinicoccus roseus]PWR01677.1 UDP-3-O-[3-hydroxymyristoyl] N-acetylglucosamine deacetylase [Meridianimarinicoccus roseus]